MDIAKVPKEKIIIGKPCTSRDVMNTGLVSGTDLGIWAKQAYQAFGWKSGIMTWQYSSDLDNSFVNAFLAASGF